MKVLSKKTIFIVFLLIAIAFFAGMNYQSYRSLKFNKPILSIEQEIHFWTISRKSDEPTVVTVYAKNISNVDVDKPVRFTAILDPTGIEKSFLTSLISVVGKEGVEAYPNNTNKFKAIRSYIERGMKTPEGLDYEPIESPDHEMFKTSTTQEVSFTIGETKKLQLSYVIPPKYMGYRLKIIQE
ncbi:hypothetical protein ACWJJH_18085 [Endozoicomonadaceae bacterium StTr2]